jgi:hypothetical protein
MLIRASPAQWVPCTSIAHPIALRDSSSNSIFVLFVSLAVEKLLHHGAEWQDDFAIEFVEYLRETGVDR